MSINSPDSATGKLECRECGRGVKTQSARQRSLGDSKHLVKCIVDGCFYEPWHECKHQPEGVNSHE